MKKVSSLAFLLGLALSVVAVAQDKPQAPPDPAKPSATSSDSQPAKMVTGTISQVDNSSKMFVVKDEAGKDVTVYWDDSTRVSGELKEGATVSVQANDQGGKTLATSIQVRTKKSY